MVATSVRGANVMAFAAGVLMLVAACGSSPQTPTAGPTTLGTPHQLGHQEPAHRWGERPNVHDPDEHTSDPTREHLGADRAGPPVPRG